MPDEILWTSNSGQGLSARYKVEFVYETRPTGDQRFGYDPGGGKWARTKRINRIEVTYNGSDVATYDLDYSQSGASGRSQLDTVTLKRNADSLPETIFTWQEGTAGWASGVATGMAAGTVAPLIGDIDNDGRDDVIVHTSGTWKVYRGRTDGNLESAINTGLPGLSHVFDYDGDGKDDLIYPSGGTWYVKKSTGTAFGSAISTSISTSSVPTFIPMDYDGDGLTDMVYSSGTAVKWRRRISAGTFGSEQSILDLGLPMYWDSQKNFPDLNGDGHGMLYFEEVGSPTCAPFPPYTCYYPVEIAVVELGGGTYQVFGGGTAYYLSPPNGAAYGIDYNGDGLDDVMMPNIDTGTWILAPNNGVTMDTANSVDTNISIYNNSYLVADYNNDGREDLLYGAGNTRYVHLSTGTTLSSSPITFASSGAGSNPSYLADTTGDGLLDIVQKDASGNWLIHKHNGGLPDVVTTFENGLGHEIDVTYQSLSQTIGDHYHIGVSTPTSSSVEEFTGPRYVVTDVVRDDGIGGTRSNRFSYGSAFYDRSGRGWLSFFWKVDHDVDRSTQSVSWFNQDWPYAGTPYLQRLREGSPSYQTITESDMTWVVTTNTSPNPDVHFIRVESTTSKEWENGGVDDGDLIRTVVDNSTYNTTYGYLEERTITTTDPSSNPWITDIDYDASVDTDDWCLGLPGEVVTINTSPGPSTATRKLDHSWNSANCSLVSTTDKSDANTANQLKVSYTYDGYGNPNVISANNAISTAQTRSVDLNFDSWGHAVTSETNVQTNLATMRTWDYVNAQPASVTGPDGLTTSYSYDSFGRIESVNTPTLDTDFIYDDCTSCFTGDAVYYVQADHSDGSDEYEYFDALNRSVGSAWTLRGGGQGRTLTEYNGIGQVDRVSQPYVSGESIYWVNYEHDLIGRVLEIDAPVSESVTSGAITTYEYLGETIEVTDAESNTTKTEFNAVGQVVKVTDAANSYATYTYKPFGELASMTDAESNATTIGYDARGFKSSMSDPNMGSWSYGYSIYGELYTQTNALSQTTTLSYDAAGRLTTRVEPEGTTTWSYYAYNDADVAARGKLLSISAPNSYSESYDYVLSGSGIGQAEEVRRTFDSRTYDFNMTYDAQGRLNVLTYPVSTASYRFKVDYDYDAYGHLQYVKDGNEAYTYYTLTTTDALGRARSASLGNGRTETRNYDEASGYLLSIATNGSVQDLEFTYDEVGNVLTRTDDLIGETETFEYDALNRLESTQVTGETAVTIAYSAAGRITSKSDVGSYSYGAGAAGPFAVTSANGLSYTYDANGRMITRGSGEIAWTSYDKPSQIDNTSDTAYAQFWYGPDRARYKQYDSASGDTIRYVGGLFEFTDPGSGNDVYRHYVHSGDRVVAMVTREATGSPTNEKQYLHQDNQGSVTKITNAAGSIDQKLAFDAWGLRRNATDWSPLGSPFAGSHEIERGYTGHEHLDAIGLIHMNGRVQDPELGRFISADPFIQAPYSTQSHNRYSYVWNNPASLIDPSGFCTEEDGWTDCPTVVARTECNLQCQGARAQAQGEELWTWHDEWLAQLRNAEREGLMSFLGYSEEDLFGPSWGGSGGGPGPSSAGATRGGSGGGPGPNGGYTPAGPETGHASISPPDASSILAAVGWTLIAFDVANSFVSPTPDAGIVGAGMISGSRATAAERARAIQGALSPRTQRSVTTAVTETREGIRVVTSSEGRLRPAQRAALQSDEVAGVGQRGVHAEINGVNAARNAGLTPTGVAPSRPACSGCTEALENLGISLIGP